MNIVSKEKNKERLEDGINTLLNLDDEQFGKVIELLKPQDIKSSRGYLDNINFWYATDKCESPENETQLGLSKDNNEDGNWIGKGYFGGKRYNVKQILEKTSTIMPNLSEESKEYQRIEELLNSRDLNVFKSYYQMNNDVDMGVLDKVFEILGSEETLKKMIDFDNNEEYFSTEENKVDKSTYLKHLGKIFGTKDKEGKLSNENSISKEFYVQNLDLYKESYSEILERYNLDRYTNPKYEFKSCNPGEQIIRKGDEPDWNIDEKLHFDICDGIPEGMTLEERALYIYTKLCKVMKYDQGYFFRNKLKDNRYEADFSKEQLESIGPDSKITCFDFSRIYTKFINEIDGDIEAVVVSHGLNQGHFSTGIYTDKVSLMLEPVNLGEDGNNDLMKAKNGMKLEGMKIISDRDGLVDKALKEAYPLVFGQEQTRISDYVSNLKDLPKEQIPNDFEMKFESFIQVLNERQIEGNEASLTLMSFEKLGFFGDQLKKAFIGRKYNEDGKDKYGRMILVRTKSDDKTTYLFDTDNPELKQVQAADVIGKLESRRIYI
jgi:hypothetical protein